MTIQEFGQTIKSKYPQYQSYSDEDIGNAMLKKYPVYQSQITTPTAQGDGKQQLSQSIQKQNQQTDSFFNKGLPGMITSNLPTIGGTAGMLIGGAVGSPTGPGALATTAGGGAVGSAAGEALKEKLQKGNIDLGQVGIQGALGAAAAPIGAIGGKILGGIVSRFIPKAATDLAEGTLSKITQQTKDWLSNFTADKTDIRGMNLTKTANQLINWGFDIKDQSGLQKLQQATEQLTGTDGIINKIKTDAIGLLGDAGRNVQLNADSILNAAKSAMKFVPNNKSKQIIDLISKGIPKSVKTATSIGGEVGPKAGQEYMQVSPEGQASLAKNIPENLLSTKPVMGLVNPLDAFQYAKNLESQGYQYIFNKTDPTFKSIGSAFISAADEVMSSVEKTIGESGVLPQLKTPEVMKALSDISPEVAKAFQNAKTIDDLRAIEAPFVNAGRLFRYTDNAQIRQMMKLTQGVTSAMQKTAALNPMNWPGMALEKVGGAITAKAGPAVQKALGEVSPQELLQSPLAKAAGAFVSQAIPRSALVQNLIGLQSPDYGKEGDRLPSLPPGLTSRYTAKNYMDDLDRLQGMDYTDKQKSAVETYLKERYNASQSELKGILSSHKLAPQEKQFMEDAPAMMDQLNRMRAQIKATPPDAVYKVPGVAGVTEYVNPNFAQMQASMTLMQGLVDRQAVGGRISGYLLDVFKKSVPGLGDSQKSAMAKLDQYEQNLVNKYKSLAPDYAASQQSNSLNTSDTTLPTDTTQVQFAQ